MSDKHNKGQPSNQSGKTFADSLFDTLREQSKLSIDEQMRDAHKLDEDDGLLFFHTHSVWEAISKLEKFYECKIYGVLEMQDIVENLRWLQEDENKVDNLSKQDLLNAIEYAYNKIEDSYTYQEYVDAIDDYLKANNAL